MVERALFPGYLFCQFDVERKLPVISSAGVEYIVSVNQSPANIADEVIANIRRAVEAGARPVPYLRAGQRVRVKFGFFAGMEGLFTREAAKGQLILSIAMLQRSVALYVDEDLVCPI